MASDTMLHAALLQLIRDAGEAVLTLTEGVQRDELMRSRLTRAEVQRQLLCLADALGDAPDALRHRLPEIDWAGWAGWRAARRVLAAPDDTLDEVLWFAVQSLVPATLSWLRVHRDEHPGWFEGWR